jgi:N-acetylmuramoyl-L-alanine amidase
MVCFGLAVLAGCSSPSCGSKQSGAGGDGAGHADRAKALLAPGAVLPPRAEAAAVAEQLAIESSNKGKNAQGAALARLAGDLRVRMWRVDQTATDAREAMDLYAAAAGASAGTEEGCEAERRRALLAAELARDAAVGYRELYLTRRRHAASLGPAAERSRCIEVLAAGLAEAAAYRPSGDALRALEREGDAAADAAARGMPASAATAGSAVAPASAAPSTVPVASGSPRDLVVSPREDSVAKGPVKITSIEKYGADKGGRVVIQLSAPATFNVGTLAADDAAGKDARIFVDIARATAKGVAREIDVGGVIRRVRVGAQTNATRVVLDLTATPFRRVFYLPDPFRIVVDVSTRPPGGSSGGSDGKREVKRVALDPGHGGNDHGAVGPTGLREKEVTLDIAHRAAPLLAHELKVETVLTRDSDVFVPLDARTARANSFHADLFVSIHCNASDNGQARGVQTFYLDEVKEQDAFAARVAARENAQRGAKGDIGRADGEIASILSNLNVGDMAARSRHMAGLLQRAALASAQQRYPDIKDQGVKTAGFFVLAGADMPAALFETAFISNTDDEGRLATADFRQKMADAIVNAVKAYRDGK